MNTKHVIIGIGIIAVGYYLYDKHKKKTTPTTTPKNLGINGAQLLAVEKRGY